MASDHSGRMHGAKRPPITRRSHRTRGGSGRGPIWPGCLNGGCTDPVSAASTPPSTQRSAARHPAWRLAMNCPAAIILRAQDDWLALPLASRRGRFSARKLVTPWRARSVFLFGCRRCRGCRGCRGSRKGRFLGRAARGTATDKPVTISVSADSHSSPCHRHRSTAASVPPE